jgi:hypothetical protein
MSLTRYTQTVATKDTELKLAHAKAEPLGSASPRSPPAMLTPGQPGHAGYAGRGATRAALPPGWPSGPWFPRPVAGARVGVEQRLLGRAAPRLSTMVSHL